MVSFIFLLKLNEFSVVLYYHLSCSMLLGKYFLARFLSEGVLFSAKEEISASLELCTDYFPSPPVTKEMTVPFLRLLCNVSLYVFASLGNIFITHLQNPFNYQLSFISISLSMSLSSFIKIVCILCKKLFCVRFNKRFSVESLLQEFLD